MSFAKEVLPKMFLQTPTAFTVLISHCKKSYSKEPSYGIPMQLK